MKIHNKISFIAVVTGLTILGILAIGGSSPASASSPWCDVLAPNANNSMNSCHGITENAMDGVSSVSSLISRIQAFQSYGGYQAVGANYIINGLGGSDWIARLQQPGITVTTGGYTTTTNTAYDPSTNSIVQYPYPGTFDSVLVEFNGVVVYAIKIDCGNPLGDLPGPPPPAINHAPTGGVSVACRADGSAVITYTFADQDGPSSETRAYANVSTGGAPGGPLAVGPDGVTVSSLSPLPPGWTFYGLSRSGSRTIPASQTNGNYNTWLYAQDVGSSANHDYYRVANKSSISCSHPVVGPGCPGDPTYLNIGRITLSTPFLNPDNTYAPSGTSSSPGSVWLMDTNIRNAGFTSIDTSSGGNRYPPSIVSYNSNKTTVKIDPSIFVSKYPYDPNSSDVNYHTDYDVTTYIQDVFDHYQCDGGGTYGRGGNGCGYYDVSDPSTCYGWNHIDHGTVRTNCVAWRPCPSLGTPPDGCYHREAYPSPTAYYRWRKASGPTATATYGTSSGYSMNECYLRNFEASWSPMPTNGTLSPTAEDPNSANFTGQVTIKFSGPVDTKDLRNNSVVSVSSSGNINSPSGISPYGACSGSSATVGSSYSSPDSESGNTLTLSCPIQAPPLQAGQSACANFYVSPQSGSVDYQGNMSSTGGRLSANPCTNQVTNESYAHFFLGDVSAGGAFANSRGQCSASSPGFIEANVEQLVSGQLLRGSGAQLAGLALGSVSGFGSASLRSSSPASTNGLTFSNTMPGNFGKLGVDNCIPDYYDAGPATDQTGSQNVNGQNYYYIVRHVGNLTLPEDIPSSVNVGGVNIPVTSGGKINPGINLAFYVSGSVTIDNNVQYGGSNGTWAMNGFTSNVPSLYVIAKNGAINISSNVHEIDGVYITQGGNVNTCVNEDFNLCQNQLFVYGSFIANNINLYRTFSSLRNSKGGEYPSGGVSGPQCTYTGGDNANPLGPGGPRGTNFDCASEIFFLSPETYLNSPALPVQNSQTRFDSVESLSPVL